MSVEKLPLLAFCHLPQPGSTILRCNLLRLIEMLCFGSHEQVHRGPEASPPPTSSLVGSQALWLIRLSGNLFFDVDLFQPDSSVRPDYVFYSDLNPHNPAITVLEGKAFGGDFTLSGLNLQSDVLDSKKQLTRLKLVHITPIPGSAIGIYRISLVN